MTLAEALNKAGEQFEVIAADSLANAEALLRSRGATDEELGIELTRLQSEIAAARQQVLATVRAVWETGIGVH